MATATLDPKPNVEQLIIAELTVSPRHIDDLVNILYRKHRISKAKVKETVLRLRNKGTIIKSSLDDLELTP